MAKRTGRKNIGTFHGFLFAGKPQPAKTSRGRDRMWFYVSPPAGWRTACVLSYAKEIHIRYEKDK
jgi:hypothetical protein